MSRNISVLERERYVMRRRAPHNARFVTVVLTLRGRNALETLRCDEQDVMARVFAKLPVAGRGAVADALEAVEAALDSASEVASDDACCAADKSKRAAR